MSKKLSDDGLLFESFNLLDLTWDPATLTTLEVSVSDGGSPVRSSTGLVSLFSTVSFAKIPIYFNVNFQVEIKIEGGPSTRLDFEQEVYISEVNENPSSGADLIQVRIFI